MTTATAASRDVIPDILRGFALWGIVVVNVAYFATSVNLGVTAQALVATGDSVAALLVFALAQGKFYLIFSFLFGYSAHYLLGNPNTGRRRWLMRGVGLLILGVAHASLLFIGDILFIYGLLGLLLLAFYGRSERVLRHWIVWLYGLFAAAMAGLTALLFLAESQGVDTTGSSSLAAINYEETVIAGDYLASIGARFEFWAAEGIFLVLFQGALTFVAFLTGVLAARARALSDGVLSDSTIRQMIGWGLGAGLGIQLGLAGVWLGNELSASPSEAVGLAAFFGSFLTAPLLSVGYVGLVIRMIRSRPRALGFLGSMGRLSLTVYLSQSLLLSVIFSGWGLGLYQQVPYWVAVLISLAVTLVLSAGASLWLRRWGQGPLERLLTGWSKLGLQGYRSR